MRLAGSGTRERHRLAAVFDAEVGYARVVYCDAEYVVPDAQIRASPEVSDDNIHKEYIRQAVRQEVAELEGVLPGHAQVRPLISLAYICHMPRTRSVLRSRLRVSGVATS